MSIFVKLPVKASTNQQAPFYTIVLQESGHKINAGRYSMMLFLLLLADKRNREALSVAREYGNYCTEEQNKVIDNLLQGIRDSDDQRVQNLMI